MSKRQKVNFTKATLADVVCPSEADRVYAYDTKAAGLAFCLTSTGKQSFYL